MWSYSIRDTGATLTGRNVYRQLLRCAGRFERSASVGLHWAQSAASPRLTIVPQGQWQMVLGSPRGVKAGKERGAALTPAINAAGEEKG